MGLSLALPSLGFPALLGRQPDMPVCHPPRPPGSPASPKTRRDLRRGITQEEDDEEDEEEESDAELDEAHVLPGGAYAAVDPESTLPASPSDPGPAHGLLVSSTGAGLSPPISPTAALPNPLDESQFKDGQDKQQQRALAMRSPDSAVVEARPPPLPIAYVATTAALTRFTTGSSTYLACYRDRLADTDRELL